MASPEKLQITQIKIKRAIAHCDDVDGVHRDGPIPLGTAWKLLKGNIRLPHENSPLGEYKEPNHWVSLVTENLPILSHHRRSPKQGSLEGLSLFKQAAEENGHKIDFYALSGRKRNKHELTRKQLGEKGYEQYFEENNFLLNQAESSTRWKEEMVKRLVNCGKSVVTIDDDIRAGLIEARVDSRKPEDPRVLVYVLKNLSNHEWLLNHAKVEIPSNLFLVETWEEAALDFVKKLEDGQLDSYQVEQPLESPVST